MWRRILWPEFQVLWFNSVLNRSSEWGTHSIHWYFTSALPRSMIVAYPLCMVGALLDRRIVPYMLPVFLFVVLYSKLPHKELRFIIGSIPMFNVSASLAASRLYNNRKKAGWNLLYILMLGAFLVSLGYSTVTFMASYNNYPGGYALKALHEADSSVKEKMVHIDAFTAMSGVSCFCENEYPWRTTHPLDILDVQNGTSRQRNGAVIVPIPTRASFVSTPACKPPSSLLMNPVPPPPLPLLDPAASALPEVPPSTTANANHCEHDSPASIPVQPQSTTTTVSDTPVASSFHPPPATTTGSATSPAIPLQPEAIKIPQTPTPTKTITDRS